MERSSTKDVAQQQSVKCYVRAGLFVFACTDTPSTTRGVLLLRLRRPWRNVPIGMLMFESFSGKFSGNLVLIIICWIISLGVCVCMYEEQYLSTAAAAEVKQLTRAVVASPWCRLCAVRCSVGCGGASDVGVCSYHQPFSCPRSCNSGCVCGRLLHVGIFIP